MKKALAIILSLIMALSFAACSKSSEKEDSTSKETTSATDEKATDSNGTTTKVDEENVDSFEEGDIDDANELNPQDIPADKIVVKNLKAKNCKATLMSLPTTVNAIYAKTREKKTSTLIKSCDCEFSDQTNDKVTLKLTIKASKTFDGEGGKLSSSFLINLFDSKNNLVAKCVAHSQQGIGLNEEFTIKETFGNLTDEQYYIAFVQTT